MYGALVYDALLVKVYALKIYHVAKIMSRKCSNGWKARCAMRSFETGVGVDMALALAMLGIIIRLKGWA